MRTLFDGIWSLDKNCEVLDIVASQFRSSPKPNSWIIGVTGDLGAGKTTLFQCFLRHMQETWDETLGKIRYIQSPTFTYVRSYEGKLVSLWHVDAFRIKQRLWHEVHAMWEEPVDERLYIMWVEWFDRLQNQRADIKIDLSFPELDPQSCRSIRVFG